MKLIEAGLLLSVTALLQTAQCAEVCDVEGAREDCGEQSNVVLL